MKHLVSPVLCLQRRSGVRRGKESWMRKGRKMMTEHALPPIVIWPFNPCISVLLSLCDGLGRYSDGRGWVSVNEDTIEIFVFRLFVVDVVVVFFWFGLYFQFDSLHFLQKLFKWLTTQCGKLLLLEKRKKKKDQYALVIFPLSLLLMPKCWWWLMY